MSEQAPGQAAAPIARAWVPLGFENDPARSAPYKDRRAQLDFPRYAGMNVSGYQLMTFTNMLGIRYDPQAGPTGFAEGRRAQLQLVAPQVMGGGASYVAGRVAPPPPARSDSLASRLRRMIRGE